tara:strand:+ start:135 stop:329 length:195 start_codon:yes stop_codon:yes gene_type:complete
MDVEELAKISLEGCGSILLLTIAYKIYRSRIDSSTESHCCKWLDFKLKTHNSGIGNNQSNNDEV